MSKEQKTPEQWFQKLKEPYRSQAIANIDKTHYDYRDFQKSLYDSLMDSFRWNDTKQGHNYWHYVYESIKAGETTYLEPEKSEPIELRPKKPIDWEAKYNELKANFDQLEQKGEKVYFYFDYLDNLIKTTDFEFALHESSEDSPIYKGVFMGKKKSVLVNENS